VRVGAFFAAVGLALGLAAQTPPSLQRFKSSIDLVQVDVSAVDAAGRPIRDLTAADFELRVDSRPRPIVSAQFVSVPSGTAESPSTTTPAHYSSNADLAGGRLIMIVVDRSSIATGRGKAAIEAASRFVTQLNRADRIALASIPHGPQVTFTADHALVQRRIREIDGTAIPSFGVRGLGITDALAFERKDALGMQAVIERECGVSNMSPGGRGGGQSEVMICQNEVRSEAAGIAEDARERARTSIRSLRALIDSLPPSQTPKMLVLISEGLVIDRDVAQLSWLDAKAAAANVTVYSLHLESSQFDASQRRPQARPASDRALQEQGLQRIAQATRGDVFRVMSNSEFAFERLSNELSGYYLLGFEADPGDRNGRPHTINISVRRKDVIVRSRRQFTIEAAPQKTAEREIVAALRDPLPAADIPVKISTYSFRDPHHEKLRLLIAAEIDRSINPDGQMSAGYVVVDFNGKLVASQMDTPLPATALRVGRTDRYFSTVLADAGKYTVKFVVVDDAWRRGGVELLVDARLTPAGPIRATDLLLVDGAAISGRPSLAPAVSGELTGDWLNGYLELFADSPETLEQASVTLEIAESDASPVLVRVPVALAVPKETTRARVASARVNIRQFPPGDYVARAVIAVGLDAVGQVNRSFTIPRRGAK
jgi:VWFA-related protein